MKDAVRPSENSFKAMYERGYRTWAALWEMAADDRQSHRPLRNLGPVLPNQPYFPENLATKSFSNAVTVKGRTTWTTAQGPCDPCDLPPFQQEVVMQVAWSHATMLVFDADPRLATRFTNCYGSKSHHLPILLLAWAYILSARWAELIPGACAPKYNNCHAPLLNADDASTGSGDDHRSVVVDIGDVDEDAVRWWTAVLSLDGWDSSFTNDKGALLCSPWAVRTHSAPVFTISAGPQPYSPAAHRHPASFNSAIRNLAHYCHLHDIAEQNQAALAAALLIPVAKFDGSRIALPIPRLPRKVTARAQHAVGALPDWGGEFRQLDRLLTLSCYPRGIKSLLGSIFFEPDVDCNVCGAWLQGSFAFLDSDKTSDEQVLMRTIIRRDPGLGFLWLGAFITGAEKRCLQEGRSGWWKVDLSTAAWTGTHVSFIQQSIQKAPLAVREISRADECRLMYLSHQPDHTSPPILPFGPFGFTAIQDTGLDVRQHFQCEAAHGLGYGGFTWDCQGGKVVEQGVDDLLAATIRLKTLPPPDWNQGIPIDFDDVDVEDEISEMITRNVFTWLRGEDGFPIAERAIREHEWINNLVSDDDSSVEEDFKSTTGENVGRWLLALSTETFGPLDSISL